MGLRSAVRRAVYRRYPELYWRRRGRMYYANREETGCERLMHAAVVERIAALAPKRVLEYGVGNAAFLKKIDDRVPGVECFGVDISPTQLAVARANFPEARLSAGNLTRLDFPDDHFDVVVGLGVLIYVQPRTRRRTFAELHRVCSGHLVAVEYVTKFFDAEMQGRFDRAGDFRYEYDLEAEMRRAGFAVSPAEKIAVTWDPGTNPDGELPHGIILARKP